jgi:hypothetical protein
MAAFQTLLGFGTEHTTPYERIRGAKDLSNLPDN